MLVSKTKTVKQARTSRYDNDDDQDDNAHNQAHAHLHVLPPHLLSDSVGTSSEALR